jgi:hypothetical protein
MLPRLLVLANVFLSVGLFAWALTLAGNRLDWVDAKTDTGTVKGQITLLKEEIDQASKAATGLSERYVERTRQLANAEADQKDRKRRLDKRLADARAGSFRKQEVIPARQPNAGFTDVSKDGAPDVVSPSDSRPLRGLKALADDLAREVAAADRALAGDAPLNEMPEGGLGAALADDAQYTALTDKLGVTSYRKLQDLITAEIGRADVAVLKQKEIRGNLQNEGLQLQAVRVNWRAQLQDLLDRQGQLGRRLAGLRGN